MESNRFAPENFLLQNNSARKLYYDYAAELPIIDYHCHLPPAEIAANKQFSDITEIWLKGDHYKWRAMRTLGVSEELITGDAGAFEKFAAWAKSVPELVRNPVFHWTQMELFNPFGIDKPLNAGTSEYIYESCNASLATPEFFARGILTHFAVEFVGTTDDPCDSLEHHKAIAVGGFPTKVAPSFRPDKILNISNSQSFFEYKDKLGKVAGVEIVCMDTLLQALKNRVDYFHEAGCRISDHGLERMPLLIEFSVALQQEFKEFINEKGNSFSDPEAFAGYVLHNICKMYHEKGWVQQFHLGAIRNTNSRMMRRLGADSGVDSIGDFPQATALANFLNALDEHDQLPKTVLYNNNPADNELFATMAGNFNDGSVRGKVQFGSAWWFLDQKDGIEKQLNTLSQLGVLSTFIGMITDSRSFLSYPRQDYFRRILCNILGQEMETGLIPADEKWIGGLVYKICYQNAKNYFGL